MYEHHSNNNCKKNPFICHDYFKHINADECYRVRLEPTISRHWRLKHVFESNQRHTKYITYNINTRVELFYAHTLSSFYYCFIFKNECIVLYQVLFTKQTNWSPFSLDSICQFLVFFWFINYKWSYSYLK